MVHAFPEASVQIARQAAERYFLIGAQKKSLLHQAYSFYEGCKNGSSYGFNQALFAGMYAPWPHEAHEQRIAEDNCTTIIPWLYLSYEALGIKPEIIQFVDWRQFYAGAKKPQPFQNASHFALLLDVGKDRKYLCDPFWQAFGLVRSEDEHTMCIRSYPQRSILQREYRALLHYTPEEFAVMINRLHEPAESLEMLVAGQRLFENRRFHHVECDEYVYYDDAQNVVTTRLLIPHHLVRHKAIYGTLPFDDSGQVDGLRLRFVMYDHSQWNSLQGEVVVAHVDLSAVKSVSRAVERVVKQQGRIGSFLYSPCGEDIRHSLCDLAEDLWKNLSAAQQEKLRKWVAVRTLYEHTSLEGDYIFSEVQRDEHLRSLMAKVFAQEQAVYPLQNTSMLNGWKIDRLPLPERRALRRKLARLNGKLNGDRDEFKQLRSLRYHHSKVYHRLMDKICFAAQNDVNRKSVGDLEAMVQAQGSDWRVGYIAMVADYVPFVSAAWRDLTLQPYLGVLGEKVKARREKRAIKEEK